MQRIVKSQESIHSSGKLPVLAAILLAALLSCAPQPSGQLPDNSTTQAETTIEETSTATATDVPDQQTTEIQESVRPTTMNNLIPLPQSIQQGDGSYTVDADFAIYVDPPSAELLAVGEQLAGILRPSTGFEVPVRPQAEQATPGGLLLTTTSADSTLGYEGYELTITPDAMTLQAPDVAGLFYGVQTLRQLFPPAVEATAVQPNAWVLPTGQIRDTPRYEWRGVMLDVSRHFFTVDDVKRYIDLASSYKLNRLHLHLSDDQGWRIEIKSWPELTRFGSQTEVGGGEGGFYTQEEYADLVTYAAEHFMMVVPEIDTPGHSNAALASYPELNCDDVAPQPYTGIEVGFSSLCIDKEITYTFLNDVIGELAAMTPGPYIHIGGDEALATQAGDYVRFIERVNDIVDSHGKQLLGWEEIGRAELSDTAVAQHWANTIRTQEAVRQGLKVIMSPASRIYLDMKYDEASPLGLSWAGYVSVEDSYSWDPATQLADVTEENILGVEAPLWSETLETIDDIEFMAFPRLPGAAEIAWSAAESRNWEEYRLRLAAHGPTMAARGINFYRTPEVPWP